MTSTQDFLVEIGTEELPPKALSSLATAFSDAITAALSQAELPFSHAKTYATPRRLAVIVTALATKQNDRTVERRGPAVNAAFDDSGQPKPAALGFAKSCGVTVENLTRIDTPKGAWLTYSSTVTGSETQQLLPDIISSALAKLPIPKRMRWGDRDDQFVRPVHWLVLLFGDQILDASILGCTAGRETWGHRFHCNQALSVTPQNYVEVLANAKVVADFAERRQSVKRQIQTKANEIDGHAVIDDALLDEVTGLVEWPVAVLGNFAKKFLEIPAEALISAMKNHQKYFHVVDAKQQLLPYFITLSNIDSANLASVQAGNERVIRPRLEDAAFFWQQDKKQPLHQRIKRLSNVVFQKKLGSVGDKVNRAAQLCEYIATQFSISERRTCQTICFTGKV